MKQIFRVSMLVESDDGDKTEHVEQFVIDSEDVTGDRGERFGEAMFNCLDSIRLHFSLNDMAHIAAQWEVGCDEKDHEQKSG